MGQRGCYVWDDKKAELLLEVRGYHIVDIAETLLDGEISPAFYRHLQYPEQLRAIGPHKNRLFTVVFEDRDDEYGKITHLSNYWEASVLFLSPRLPNNC